MTGTANVLSKETDIPRLDDCLHLCLDTTGCFAVTFYETNLNCLLHNGENWTDTSAAVSTMFVFLTCEIEGNLIFLFDCFPHNLEFYQL